MRRVNSENKIYLEQTNLNLSGISAIKVNPDELRCLTNTSNIDGIKILQKKGIDNVILTDKQNISLLSENKIYSITLPDIVLNDTTGIGDIFSSAFCCTMLKEKDVLWALSFAERKGKYLGACRRRSTGCVRKWTNWLREDSLKRCDRI